jgi:hypothetical protein
MALPRPILLHCSMRFGRSLPWQVGVCCFNAPIHWDILVHCRWRKPCDDQPHEFLCQLPN